MESFIAYLFVGSVAFLLLVFAFMGFSWIASAILLVCLVLISPFALLLQLCGNKRNDDETRKKAIIEYHQFKYGIMEKMRK